MSNGKAERLAGVCLCLCVLEVGWRCELVINGILQTIPESRDLRHLSL